LDGNKRTALTAALVFLDINGIEIIDPKMRLYDAMISIANKEMDKNAMAELLAKLTK
jgi:death-on-curing protein